MTYQQTFDRFGLFGSMSLPGWEGGKVECRREAADRGNDV
jgi:hypothetical protein